MAAPAAGTRRSVGPTSASATNTRELAQLYR